MLLRVFFSFFFFNAPAPSAIYTLSLHDALPISMRSWFLPLRGHPPRKQTLALGSCLTLAPSGWCALRDSGHQRRFFHVCEDRKSTRLNSSHITISYAVFCLKKKTKKNKKKQLQK